MYSSSSLTFRFFKIILLAAATLFAFTTPPSTLGNPITKRQFQKVVKLLEESITKEIPSEAADQYSDMLYQEKHDQKNVTFYHAGDKKFPVFISNGLGSMGKPIHVLLRGEDYINPKDKNNFVVLKQLGSTGTYTVHQAHILNTSKFKKGGKVIWNDCRVEQQQNIKPLLQQMGNSEVQARSLRSQRPLCDWIGYTLFCQTTKYVPPARERKEREPLDEEDDQPVKLPGIVSEENPERGGKSKRYSGPDTSINGNKKDNKITNGNELGEDSSDEISVITKGPANGETDKTATIATMMVTPKSQAPTIMGRAVIVKDVETGVSEKAGEEDERMSKRKHKKKRKSKRKQADENKED